MKQIFYTLIVLILSSLSVISCKSEKISFEDNNEGTKEIVELNLRSIIGQDLITVDTSVETRVDDASRATNVDISSYIVVLYQSDDKLVQQWTYSELPELVSVLEGDYYLLVKSHEQLPLDTKAYYEGKSEVFSVKAGAVTEVQPITCKMRSIKVVVTIDQTLLGLLGNDIEIEMSLGEALLKITDISNIPPYYFAPVTDEDNIFNITFKGTVDGYYENHTQPETANAGSLLKVDFTLKNVSDEEIVASGTAGISIKVNETVTNIETDGNVKIDDEVIYEEPENPDEEDTKPTIVGRGFNIDEPQNVPKDGFECIVDITAANRFANLYVTIDSETLTADVLESVGLVSSFDLAYPGDLGPKLGEGGLGFPVGDQVIGQKNLVFNITAFTPLLNIYGAATHKFIIRVVDQTGVELEKTLTLITE